MSLIITRPVLSLKDYAGLIKLNEKYIPEIDELSSEAEKLEIINSLLHMLIVEERLCDASQIPDDYADKRNLLRALLNVRPPLRLKETFLKNIDRLLQHELCEKTVVECDEIPSVSDKYHSTDLLQSELLEY